MQNITTFRFFLSEEFSFGWSHLFMWFIYVFIFLKTSSFCLDCIFIDNFVLPFNWIFNVLFVSCIWLYVLL